MKAQGRGERRQRRLADALGCVARIHAALKGRPSSEPHAFGALATARTSCILRCARPPRWGSVLFVPLTQGAALGFHSTPRWGCESDCPSLWILVSRIMPVPEARTTTTTRTIGRHPLTHNSPPPGGEFLLDRPPSTLYTDAKAMSGAQTLRRFHVDSKTKGVRYETPCCRRR